MNKEKDRLIWTAHCKKAGFAKALQWAVIENDLDMLHEALAAGHDPNGAEMGRKPAELAVEFKTLEALKVLLAAGADEYSSKIGNNHGYALAAGDQFYARSGLRIDALPQVVEFELSMREVSRRVGRELSGVAKPAGPKP